MKVLINNVEYHNKYKFSFAIIIPEEQVYSTRIFNKILFLTITKKNHKFSFSMQFAFSASHSSPTIFPFFENRAYTTWKNHVCVWKSVVTSKQPQNMDTISGVVSFPLDGRHEAGIRRADQATSGGVGARAIRILKTCRSSYVFGIEDPGNAIVSGRFARPIETFLESSHETGPPLRKLDPKLFLLFGFKPPRQIFYGDNDRFSWRWLRDIMFIFEFLDRVNWYFSSYLVD